jgi:hypothetical protein
LDIDLERQAASGVDLVAHAVVREGCERIPVGEATGPASVCNDTPFE